MPIAIFAFKSLKNVKISKLYLDPNLILANSSMARYKNKNASKTKKPYVIYMAEIIYSYVSIIKKKNFRILRQKKLLINLWKQKNLRN